MSDDKMMDTFREFIDALDLYPKSITEFPTFGVDRFGFVYNENGERVKPYHYDGQYDSVYLKEGSRHGKRDVHVLVAKTHNPEYYPGCVVHHKDENKYNNCSDNLKIESKSEHARHHADPTALIEWSRTHEPVNKGKKPSAEFREHCRIAALKRMERQCELGIESVIGNGVFYGNQYVNADGSRK